MSYTDKNVCWYPSNPLLWLTEYSISSPSFWLLWWKCVEPDVITNKT